MSAITRYLEDIRQLLDLIDYIKHIPKADIKANQKISLAEVIFEICLEFKIGEKREHIIDWIVADKWRKRVSLFLLLPDYLTLHNKRIEK